MGLIESGITILSTLSGVASLHSWYTGLKIGNQLNNMLLEQDNIKTEIKRLSEHILYLQSIQQVYNTKGNSEKLTDLREILRILEPIQLGLNEDILSTAIISTPTKLRQAFKTDPWKILIEIRPVKYTRRPANPDLVPIIFTDNGVCYIGWQTKGALPLLLNCDYSPDILEPQRSNLISSIINTPTIIQNDRPISYKTGTIEIGRTGYIDGLEGMLNPILDSSNCTYIYADNIAIEDGKIQPVTFSLNHPFYVEDCKGNRFELQITHINKNSSIIKYKQLLHWRERQKADLQVNLLNSHSQPIERAHVLVIFPDGTYLEGYSGSDGIAQIQNLKHRLVTIYCAHELFLAFIKDDLNARLSATIQLSQSPSKGSVIIKSTGYIPGLEGRLNPILDDLNRTYLYADNISINNGKRQPADFRINEPILLKDKRGRKFELKIISIISGSSLIEYTSLN